MLKTKYKIMYMNWKVLKVYIDSPWRGGIEWQSETFSFFYIAWIFVKEMDLCMIDMVQNTFLKLQTFGNPLQEEMLLLIKVKYTETHERK